jgi:hypothetical protein
MEQISYILFLVLIVDIKLQLSEMNWTRIFARAFDHLMGETDHDEPTVPILSQREANISLVLRTCWVMLHVITCLVVIASNIHHW